MIKQEALNKLRENGIELICVTERVYRWNQCDMAREDYNVPEDAIIPTKEQYDKIIDIVGEDGLYEIFEEYIKYKELRLWSSSKCFENSSSSWYLAFFSGYSGQAYWNYTTKANGFSIALWDLPENF